MEGFAKYRAAKALGPALVLTYATMALLGTQLNGREVFPFFNWSLFPSASNPKSDAVLIVTAIDGQKLAKPTLFFDLPDRFAAAENKDIKLAKALDRLAFAVRREDKATESGLKATIEALYLRDAESVEYDLAIISYNPIDRLNTGAIQSETILRSYRKR